jgi:hypothetical protein
MKKNNKTASRHGVAWLGKDEEGSKKKRDRKRTQNERQVMLTHILNEDRKQTTEKKNIEGKEYEKEKTKGGEGRE